MSKLRERIIPRERFIYLQLVRIRNGLKNVLVVQIYIERLYYVYRINCAERHGGSQSDFQIRQTLTATWQLRIHLHNGLTVLASE